MTIYPTGLSMLAQNSWRQHNDLASKALERVCSGKRINRAADDPAGIGIAERMKAQLTILSRQQDIAADMMSTAEIEDGILNTVGNMMRQMQDLAQRAANGSMSEQDRRNLDAEYQELLKGINGMDKCKDPPPFNLFGPSDAFDGANSGPPAVQTGAELPAGDLTMKTVDLADYLDALDSFMTGLGSVDANSVRDQVLVFTKGYLKNGTGDGKSGGLEVVPSNLYTLKITGNNVQLTRSPRTASDLYGLTGTNLLTQESASAAMDAMKNAQEILLSRRGEYGALESRLTHTISSLQSMEDGLTESYSRLMDADIAKEYSAFVREQMLCQVSSMMMSHINSNAYQVLQLLQ